MSRGKAYALCAGIVAAVLAADVLLLASPPVLSPVVERELRRAIGDALTFTSLKASPRGSVELQGVGLHMTEKDIEVLSADRARVTISNPFSPRVDSIRMEGVRLRLTEELLERLVAEGKESKPVRDVIAPDRLPRIFCLGGTFEIAYPTVLSADAPQAFRISELSLVPALGYRYFLAGRIRNETFGEWTISGDVDLETGEHQVLLRTEAMTLGPAIRAALAPAIRPDWDKFRPSGLVQVLVLLRHDRSRPTPEEEFRAVLRPVDMGIVYRHFPYPVEHATGEIEFTPQGFQVKNLRGWRGTTAIRFDGFADGYSAEAGYHFRVEMDRVPLDDTLRGALSESAAEVWTEFAPAGELDARATVHRDAGPDREARIPVQLQFRDASLRYRGLPYPIERVHGEILVDGSDIDVRYLKGVRNGAQFRFSGRIDSIESDPVIDLDVEAKGLPLDDPEFRDALSPALREVWDRFTPTGRTDLDLRILRDRGRDPRFHAALRVRGNRIRYKEIPLAVVLSEGEIEYAEGKVRLNHLRGDLEGGGQVEVSGHLLPTEKGYQNRIHIDGTGVPIDDAFKEAMTPDLRNLLRTLRLSGEADFKLTLDDGKKEMGTALELHLRKGVIASDVRVEEIDGSVTLSGAIRNGSPFIQGQITLHEARVLKRKITNLTTSFDLQGTALNFKYIRGNAYGGHLLGGFLLDTRTDEIGGDFRIERLNLKEFVRDTEKFHDRKLEGTVNLEIRDLKGIATDLQTLSGSGSMSITEGQLLGIPGIVRFLDPTSVGVDRRFSAAKIFFDIKEREFKINEFVFFGQEGEGSVYGKGTMDFQGKFRLDVGTETGSLFGLRFFLADIPGLLFDFLKLPLKKTYEGSIDEGLE